MDSRAYVSFCVRQADYLTQKQGKVTARNSPVRLFKYEVLWSRFMYGKDMRAVHLRCQMGAFSIWPALAYLHARAI